MGRASGSGPSSPDRGELRAPEAVGSPGALAAHVAGRVAARLAPGTRLGVALSGGLDSVALLDLLAAAAPACGIALSALHVHHGLSRNADSWARFCSALCAGRGIPLTVERVRVDARAPEGPEAAARSARYAAFAARGEPVLALAHHEDDQAETVLLQLLRGTGLKGVAAMPEWRPLPGTGVTLFRPLLGASRALLRAYAEGRGLAWIEDESNLEARFDRNYLRQEVAARLEARFPGWADRLARFARHAAAAEALLGELAALDGVPAAAGEALAVAPLRVLPETRRLNALRAFLAKNGLAMPAEARLAQMAAQLLGARSDARVRLEHDGAALVRHRGAIAIVAAGRPGTWRVDWRGERELELGADRGRVRFDPATGEGLCAGRATGEGWHFAPRAGGERVRLGERRPTRTLKNLLHESAVPAWQRERLPLLFHGSRLVWVPGIGIAAGYACAPGEAGLRPSWTPFRAPRP